MTGNSSRFKSALDVMATIAMVVASSAIVWAVFTARQVGPPIQTPATPPGSGKAKPLPVAPVPLEGASVRGSTSAAIGILEFSDFECPYCAKFHAQSYPDIEKKYIDTGKVLLAFRHLPISTIHPLAAKAAEAAECAGKQGQFWKMHDELFRPPKQLAMEHLLAKAKSIDLNLVDFQRCISGEMSDKVHSDAAQARELAITGTPTFLFGRMTAEGRLKVTRRESGAIPAVVLSRILDELLIGSGPPAR
jgi:protein-disulfide isomerase